MKALEDDMCVTLAMLRHHINLLGSPLYHLPTDLFPEVASHLTSETDLVNATHVSHHLRNALLSHPNLWSHLNFEHETRAWVFFDRSGQSPLHIDMSDDDIQAVGSLAELRQQSNRIATLQLCHWSIQKKFLSEPLPSLRWLEIFAEHYGNDWNEDRDTWTPVWGPTEEATSWSFPSLTSLIVHGLDPAPFYTPYLTRFKSWDTEGWTSTSMLLSFLDSCPLLEHIDILLDGEWSGQDSTVSLPNLQTYTETTFRRVWPITALNMLSLSPFCSATLKSYNNETAVDAHDILPGFKNSDYLAEIKRVKFRTTSDADGNKVVRTLELINSKGTRLCSERVEFEKTGYRPPAQGDRNYPHTVHLDLLRNLDGRSVEVLCFDGSLWQNGEAVEFLEEVLSLGNVKTLILSRSAAEPCLSALGKDLNANGHSQWSSPIHTLIVRLGSYPPYHLHDRLLQELLCVAWKRKVAGFPFRSVSLFLKDCLGRGSEVALQELRECVERLEVVRGDDVLDWDVDKYFLDGFDHLQKNLDVQWN